MERYEFDRLQAGDIVWKVCPHDWEDSPPIEAALVISMGYHYCIPEEYSACIWTETDGIIYRMFSYRMRSFLFRTHEEALRKYSERQWK